MNRHHLLRTLLLLGLVGMFLAGLSSCKLPASQGPVTTSQQSPVPSKSAQPTSGIAVSIYATQTAQARLVLATSTPVSPAASSTPYPNPPTNTPVQIITNPSATPTRGTPVPTAVVTYVQPTPGGIPATYTLLPREYPYCIARRFNVNAAELLELNGLTASSFTYAGEVLKIPQTGDPFEGTRTLITHPDYYKVQSGDTLGSIACAYGDVSPEEIALQNNLTADTLTVGMDLLIP